jgi:Lhr-like helicase
MQYAIEMKPQQQIQNITEQSNVRIAIAIKDSDLDNEELQEVTQNLREQIEESEIVETVDLVALEQAPEQSKAFGSFILGLLTSEVNPANLMKFLGFLKDRFGDKPIELAIKTPDGRELELKASSREEFEFVLQKAQEWTNQ